LTHGTKLLSGVGVYSCSMTEKRSTKNSSKSTVKDKINSEG
jgi:hypothetical protein